MDNYLSVPLCGVGLSHSILLQHQQGGNTMASDNDTYAPFMAWYEKHKDYNPNLREAFDAGFNAHEKQVNE